VTNGRVLWVVDADAAVGCDDEDAV